MKSFLDPRKLLSAHFQTILQKSWLFSPLSSYMHFACFWTPFRWNHTLYICSGFFHSTLNVKDLFLLLYVVLACVFFYHCIRSHCMNIPQYIYLFSCWWTLFPDLGHEYYVISFVYMHSVLFGMSLWMKMLSEGRWLFKLSRYCQKFSKGIVPIYALTSNSWKL